MLSVIQALWSWLITFFFDALQQWLLKGSAMLPSAAHEVLISNILNNIAAYCLERSFEVKAEKCVILRGTWERYSHAWTEVFIFKLWKMTRIYKIEIWNEGIPCLIFALNVTMNDSFCLIQVIKHVLISIHVPTFLLRICHKSDLAVDWISSKVTSKKWARWVFFYKLNLTFVSDVICLRTE